MRPDEGHDRQESVQLELGPNGSDPVMHGLQANAVPLVEDQRTSSAAEPLAESSLAAGQSDDGAAVQAEATSQQSEENTEAAGPNEEGTSKEKALKSVKWQLRHADTVQKVLYVMGQPRNAQEWDDSSNITTALKTLNREILNSTNKVSTLSLVLCSLRDSMKQKESLQLYIMACQLHLHANYSWEKYHGYTEQQAA